MKIAWSILIWLICIIVVNGIMVYIKSAGVLLGAIPTVIIYAVAFWVAHTLCKELD